MKTLIKSRNQNASYWRRYSRENDEPVFTNDKTEFARCLQREEFDRVIIDFLSLEEAPLVEYLYRYHPEKDILLLVGPEMKTAIGFLQSHNFELIDRETL